MFFLIVECESVYLPGGFRLPPPWCLCQLCNHRSSLLAQLCSPCWPITAFRERGRYLSTHSRASPSPLCRGADVSVGEDDEREEERLSSRRAVWPEPLPAGVRPALVLEVWPWPRSVFDGLGVWGDVELPFEGEIFWAVGVLLEAFLGVRVFEALL